LVERVGLFLFPSKENVVAYMVFFLPAGASRLRGREQVALLGGAFKGGWRDSPLSTTSWTGFLSGGRNTVFSLPSRADVAVAAFGVFSLCQSGDSKPILEFAKASTKWFLGLF
jgi:hypothetical protein